MRLSIRIVPIAFLVACSGGGAQLPRHLQVGSHPNFPPDEFITASASSRDGRASAEMRARAEVCRQVRSRIVATTEDEAVLVVKGGRSEVVTRFVQKASQSADCDFGELVRVVPELGAVQSGTYWAFAVLSRREAIAALRPEFEKDAGVFRERARAALASKDDMVHFTAEYREALRALDLALPLGLEIRSIAGGRFEPLSEVFALLGSLMEAASGVRSRVSVSIRVRDAPDPAGLERALARWVGAAGVRATVGGAGPEALVLRVSASEDCSLRVGVCCTWTFVATLCDSGGTHCSAVSIPEAEGCDRKDREAARVRLLGRLGGENPARTASQALSSMVPMPPE